MGLDYYYIIYSAPCRGPMMVAKALGIELNLKVVDLKSGDHLKPEFVKLNPQHVVPTLVDGDFVLWESKAIIGYLVGKYGKDDSLYPQDAKKRAVVDRWLYFDMGLHQKFRYWAHPVMKEGKKPDPAMKELLYKALEGFDSQLKGSKYVTGDSICVADFTLVNAVCTYRALGVDMTRFPNISAWIETCSKTMAGFDDIVIKGSEGMGQAFSSLLK